MSVSPNHSSAVGPAAVPRVDAGVLAQSFAACARITRVRAGNFYHGMKLLPEPKRSAMYALYAWMRAVDDLADEPEASPGAAGEKQKRLALFCGQTERACRGELDPARLNAGSVDIWPAVQQTLVAYQIPLSVLHDMVAGQLLDQTKSRYQRFSELEGYCYQVASTVGLSCLCIWGYRGGQATRQKAIQRGIALQLTNILRDIVEDARRDRLYLPADELLRHGMDPARFVTELQYQRLCVPEPVFVGFMQRQIERAASYYQVSQGLEEQLESDSRAACWAMGEIYHQLLDRIAADPAAVLRRRVGLPGWRKLGIGLRAKFRQPWAGSGNPS